ncbi:MAG: hypothetical protein VW454_01990 [Pelagibacteraceae bacterium]
MKYSVRYKIPGDNRYLELVVEANNQCHAIKIAQAQIPSAKIIGGPQVI